MKISLRALMATNAIDCFSTFSQRKLMQGGAEYYARQAVFVTDATLRAAESWADRRSPIWIDAVPGDLVVVALHGHPARARRLMRARRPAKAWASGWAFSALGLAPPPDG